MRAGPLRVSLSLSVQKSPLAIPPQKRGLRLGAGLRPGACARACARVCAHSPSPLAPDPAFSSTGPAVWRWSLTPCSCPRRPACGRP